LLADDQVIQYVHVEELPRLHDLPGDAHVLSIYMENRFGVIVRRT